MIIDQEKTMEHERNSVANCNWCTWNNPQKTSKETEQLESKRTSGDHPSNIIKIGQNTEKSPEDLRRLAVTQTPVRNHLLTLVRKTPKRVL